MWDIMIGVGIMGWDARSSVFLRGGCAFVTYGRGWDGCYGII